MAVTNYGSNERFELKKQGDSPLEQERWIFWQQGTTLYLDAYYKEQRETTRHKYKPVTAYERLTNHRDTFKMICEEDVPLPEDVVNEVIRHVGSLLMVKRWKRR